MRLLDSLSDPGDSRGPPRCSEGGATLGRIGRAAGLGLGVAGLPLAGYTAVLLGNTAIPVWQGVRRTLPFLFVGAAMAGAGAVLELLGVDDAEARVVRRFRAVGEAVELVGAIAAEGELRRSPRAVLPLREGRSGALWTAARVLTAGALMLGIGARTRGARLAGTFLGFAGGLLLRFAVTDAGRRSAADPRATFEPQRIARGGCEGDLRRREGALLHPIGR
jgi:hypothetical protein